MANVVNNGAYPDAIEADDAYEAFGKVNAAFEQLTALLAALQATAVTDDDLAAALAGYATEAELAAAIAAALVGYVTDAELTTELSGYATTAALTTGLSGKQASDATLTGLAALTTANNQMIYATGANTFAMATLSAFCRGLLAAADAAALKTSLTLNNVDNTSDANKPVSTATSTALGLKANLASPALTGVPTAPTAALGTNTTQIATMAAISAAIANLVDTAPATLDTLNELAAALGDDPNFAATMTTALAGKLDNSHAGSGGAAHAQATTSVDGFMSAADKTKLNGVATGANNYSHPTGDGSSHVPATGTGSNGRFLRAGATANSASWQTAAKGDVGLGNVDNTSDLDKPVSTATSAALAGKLDNAHAGSGGAAHAQATTSVDGFMSAADKTKLNGVATGANNYSHPTGDGNRHVPATGTTNNRKFLMAGATAASESWQTILKGDVGLGNVDNTSDLNKPISTATQAALDAKLAASHAGTGGAAHAVATGSVAGFMSAADKTKLDTIAGGVTGTPLRTLTTELATLTSSSALIPYDDTLPQIGEGLSIMTLAITPASASNILLIEAVIPINIALASGAAIAALFLGGAANAIAVDHRYDAVGYGGHLHLRRAIAAGTTSSITAQVNLGVGSSGPSAVVNGNASGRLFGGASRAVLSITEIKG